MFNFTALNRIDRLEIKSFKVLGLDLYLNNQELKEYDKWLMIHDKFVERGTRIEIEMELKKYCESDAFCNMMTKFYGSMYKFKLIGDIDRIKKSIRL